MAVRQFKELERKDINQPDDKVTVTVAPAEGLSTADGHKEQGESFELPASAARQYQRAGFVNVGDSHPGNEVEIRIEAYENFWDSRKAVEKAQKEAKANALKDLGQTPEEVQGQPGLAEADSGDPRMFSGSQTEYEAKRAAVEQGDVQPAVSPSASHSSGSPVGKSGKGAASGPEGSSSTSSSESSDSYDDMSKTDLEEEAKSRDLPASNKNKQQLVEALREDDRK